MSNDDDDDDDDREIVYEDHTIWGRTTYRSLATGKRVNAEQISAVVSVDGPPLSWYLGLSQRG